MKTFIVLLGILLIVFTGYGSSGGCGGTAPPPPIVPPEEEPESCDGRVGLQWQPSVDPMADGYYVYWGILPGLYYHCEDAGLVNFYIVEDLTCGVRHYFSVTAYSLNPDYLESDFSNEVTCIPEGG